MNPLLLAPILEFGKDLIGRFLPNKEEQQKAEMELVKLAAAGELQQVLSQLEINAKEAAHPSIWVAGWRPAFGWFGAVGFLYTTVIQPLLVWYGASKGWPSPPSINMDLMWVVITGMLGIGGLRTFEKAKGVSK